MSKDIDNTTKIINPALEKVNITKNENKYVCGTSITRFHLCHERIETFSNHRKMLSCGRDRRHEVEKGSRVFSRHWPEILHVWWKLN